VPPGSTITAIENMICMHGVDDQHLGTHDLDAL
jgi:hypothetical protein